jgi:hypothetical protein
MFNAIVRRGGNPQSRDKINVVSDKFKSGRYPLPFCLTTTSDQKSVKPIKLARYLLTKLRCCNNSDFLIFYMEASVSPRPLLSRVKSWQLVGLGISGWVTLYSVAILSWGASSNLIGNAQGGCFATTMTLAGLEANRCKRRDSTPADPLQWVEGISTEQLNHHLTWVMQQQKYKIEASHGLETEMGFGLRAVKAGRTVVFETGSWKEPVIDLPHAQTTEGNRKRVRADLAVLVGAGTPDEAVQTFVKAHPLQLLVGQELKNLIAANRPPANQPGNVSTPSATPGVRPAV